MLSPSRIGRGLKNGFDFPAYTGEFERYYDIHILFTFFCLNYDFTDYTDLSDNFGLKISE